MSQQWSFESTHGNIRNLGCPSLQLSAIKDNNSSLVSGYFALENPKSRLSMGIMGTSCQDGTDIVLQKTLYGRPNQQFYLDESNKIVSTMCHLLAIGAPSSCELVSTLKLTSLSEGGIWQFNSEDQTIESLNCRGMFVAIGNVQTNSIRATGYGRRLEQVNAAPGIPPAFDNNTETNQDNFAMPGIPMVGASIILSNNSAEQYQLWMQKHERFHHLKGPFSFIKSSGMAMDFVITNRNGKCAHNLNLEMGIDDYRRSSQQFYLGQFGLIISVRCPGLVISVKDPSGDCNNTAGQVITLQTYEIGKEWAKWKLNNDGSIESVKCPGMFINDGDIDGKLLLLVNRTTDISWRRQNVRFLDPADTLSQEWIQDWEVSFDTTEQGYNITSFQEFSGSNSVKVCYPPNPAFNRAFDSFALGLVINNAADEDECKATRQGMGFESEHPFDTEVCHAFIDYMCDPFFSGIDHLTETLVAPTKFESVEYEEEEYEEVEYEVPE